MNVMTSLAYCLSHELQVPADQAVSIVEWLENEGVLDYAIIKETYEQKADNDA